MASQRNGGVSWTNPPGYRGESWNIALGCADRCGARCWAERQAIRQVRGRYAGLVERTPAGPRWTGLQRFVATKLSEPLHWREPRCVAVSLMGDLFGSGITNLEIASVYGVMAKCPQHRFVVLTKQAGRRREWHRWLAEARKAWTYRDCDGIPSHNVVECVSCSDQLTLDALLPDLLATPAVCRGVSLEPLLGPVDLAKPCWPGIPGNDLGWVIVGPETGPRARPCKQEWILSVVDQCRDAGVACHVKAVPLADGRISHEPAEWPDALRVRQWPEVFR